jgi:phosphoglycerol transferase MdoB-like AlkP superfamily enzyme
MRRRLPELYSRLSQQGWGIPFTMAALLAYWALLFLWGKVCFLVFHAAGWQSEPFSHVFQALIQGWKVDLSMMSYFMVLQLLLLVAVVYSGREFWWRRFQNITLLFSFLVIFIQVVELPLYTEWNHKLTFKALWFFRNPGEVFHTASWAQLFGIAGATMVFFAVAWWVQRRFLPRPGGKNRLAATLSLLVILPLLFIGARGGLSPIPIQVSEAWYSSNPSLNAAATNSAFHLISNVLQNLEAVEPYRFMSPDEALKKKNILYPKVKNEGLSVLKNARPNIVLVVLEGWSADVVEGLGGYPGTAPRMSRLIREGISFDSCYASGNLSDQGIGAVFSAFPAQPRTSIVTLPSKYPALPCLTHSLKNAGYSSSFLFGGQLMYGNIRSYIYHNKFDRVEEEKDFPSSVYRGRLGVHDGDVYARQLQLMREAQQPYFGALFTQSTHGPYDVPSKTKVGWGGKMEDYLSGLHYADSCLGAFIDRAKQLPGYENTLFVFISDHHHDTPRGYSYFAPEYRRIPFVLFGEAIKPEYRGLQLHRISSQLDLAATLLSQLRLKADDFSWSRDALNPQTPESAFYTFDEGMGIITPGGQVVWWVRDERREFERSRPGVKVDSLLELGKACLQKVTEDFEAY